MILALKNILYKTFVFIMIIVFVLADIWLISLILNASWIWWWRYLLVGYLLLLFIVTYLYLLNLIFKKTESLKKVGVLIIFLIYFQIGMYRGLQRGFILNKLDDHGLETIGKIISCDYSPQFSEIGYAWRVDGKLYRKFEGSGGRPSSGCFEGKSINIIYLPEQPWEARRKDVTIIGTTFWPAFGVTVLFLLYFDKKTNNLFRALKNKIISRDKQQK